MKFNFYLLIILLLILPGNIFTQDENTTKRLYKSADNLQAMQSFEKAIPILDELLKEDPDNPNYNFKLGLSLVESHSHRSAIPYLEKAVKEIAESYRSKYKERRAPVIALEYLAKEYFYEYRYDEAFKVFNRYLDYLPESGEKVDFVRHQIETCKSAVELMQHPINIDLLDFSEAHDVIPECHSPLFSPDESFFIFTYDEKRYEEDIDPTQYVLNEDIFYTKHNGKNWDSILPLSSNINTSKNEASVGIHPNGKQLLIYREDGDNGNLYYSDLLDDEVWSKPKKFPPTINSSSHESHATISENGDIIYFTSNRPGGFGGLDIYMSKKDKNGKWGEAINMGPKINSPYHEESPHLQAGQKTLYFSSDRLGGMGGFDIYKCTLKNDSIVDNVENIGYPLNGPGNDLFFKTSINGQKGYYSSRCKASKGELMLNIVRFNDVHIPNVIVKGLVLNSSLDTLHNLEVFLFDIDKKDICDSTFTDDGWGYYKFNLYSEREYFASFKYNDFVYFSRPFEIEKYFANYTFQNVIELDPIILTDTLFRQNIGDFTIFKSNLSLGTIDAKIDSNLNVLAHIKEQESQGLTITQTSLGTVPQLPKEEPVVEPVDTVEVIVSVPEPEIIPEPEPVVEITIEEPEPEPITVYNPPVKIKKRDWSDIADSLRDDGIENVEEKQYKNAIVSLEGALDLYEDHSDKENVLVCLNYLAMAYGDKGDLYDAINYHKQVAETSNDKEELGNAYEEIGDAYNTLYNKGQALDYFNKSLTIKSELDDTTGKKDVLNNIAEVYFKHNEFEKAIQYLEQANIYDEDYNEKASTYNKIGLSYHNLQKYLRAVEYYEKAVDFAQKGKDEKGESIYLNNIGNAKFDIKDYNEALEFYNKSLDIKRRINYQEGIALTLHNMGNTYKVIEDFESAFRYYNESQEVAEKYNLKEYMAQNHYAFSQLYALTENFEKALYHFQEYINLSNPYLEGKRKIQLSQQVLKYEVNQSDIAFIKRNMQKHELFSKLEESKRAREIELLNEKEKVQHLYEGLLMSSLVGVAIILLLLILRFRTKRKTFRILSLKNAEILQKNEEILAQRENLEQINKELEKLSIVASETDNAVAIIDENFNYEWINKGYTKLFGYLLEDINISEQNSLLEFTNNEHEKEMIKECIEKQTHVTYETLKHCKNDVEIWTQTSLTPIISDDKVYKIISIDSDIHELKKAEEEINNQKTEIEKQRDEIAGQRDIALQQKDEIEEQKDQLEETINQLHSTQKKLVESEKMASLGNLVAGVAHEINTPVGIGIAASTSLITKTKQITHLFNDKKMKQSDLLNYLTTSKDAAKLIQSNLQRTGELVKSFKRISVDEVSEQKRSFNLSQYLKDIVKSLEPKLKEKVVDLTIDCPEDIEIFSYPGMFAQIITNFIVNTIVHGYKDLKGGKVNITGREIKGILHLQYKDDGNGMEPEVVEKVFNPFFTTNMQTGTGLGMNIVYNTITQKLQGDIICESTKGEGVTFNITIPMDHLEKALKTSKKEKENSTDK